jgi:hypothetical protein
MHPFFMGELCHRTTEECLGRIGDSVGKGGDGLTAAQTQMGFVIDEERRPIFGGELGDVAATNRQLPCGADACGIGKKVERKN